LVGSPPHAQAQSSPAPSPAPAAPPKPTPAPAWAGPNNENLGSSYPGAPSPNTGAGGDLWFGKLEKKPDGSWLDASGHWRSQTGELIVPGRTEPRPIGPPRSVEHQQAIDIIEGEVMIRHRLQQE
jgi:hypothetical protein